MKRKIKASGVFYFILIVMSIFLIIQTRMQVQKEDMASSLSNPFIYNDSVVNENEKNIELATSLLETFYDINYQKLHSSDVPSEDFILYYDKSDGNKLKKTTDQDIISELEENSPSSSSLQDLINDGVELIPTPTDYFDIEIKKGVNSLSLQNIKIPIIVDDNNKIEFFSPLIKISKIESFEAGKNFFLPKVNMSILIPIISKSQKTNILFKEYSINSNKIISRKLNVAFDILDYIANSIVSKQKFFYQDNPNLSNVISPFGGAVMKLTPNSLTTDNITINTIGAKEKIGIITSGLMYINFGNARDLSVNGLADGVTIDRMFRNGKIGDISSNLPAKPSDKFEVDFRGSIQIGSGGNGSGGESFFRPVNIFQQGHIPTGDDMEKSIFLCSLNNFCGIEIENNEYDQIIKIKNVKTAEALKKMFPVLETNIEECQNNKYYFVGQKNPFATEIEDSECGENLLDFLIDNSSAFNFGNEQFQPQGNKLIFTLALKNQLTNGCAECQRFPFIFKKYYIFKE